jgi:Ca2+-binding EF-hand superfamily protein
MDVPTVEDQLAAKHVDFSNADDLDTLKAIFTERSVDGHLSKETFIAVLHELGFGDELAPESVETLELTLLFEAFDKDKSNSVSISQFISGVQVLFRANQLEMLEYAFKGLTLDADGTVCIQEFLAYFKHYFEAVCAVERRELEVERWNSVSDYLTRVFNANDTKHVGRLKVDEFKASIQKDPDHPFTLIWDSLMHVRHCSNSRRSSVGSPSNHSFTLRSSTLSGVL